MYIPEFEGVELVMDIEPARWIEERIGRWDQGVTKVSDVIPTGFDAYARIFHPAFRRSGSVLEPVRWAEVAKRSGRIMHPGASWRRITDPLRASSDWPFEFSPEDDSLTVEAAEKLALLLSKYTSSPEKCWFGLWVGWGAGQIRIGPAAQESLPLIRCPAGQYVLYRGPLDAINSFWVNPNVPPNIIANLSYQSPSFWWPNDVSWCVATPFDLKSTLIAGTKNCIQLILESSEYEALAVDLETRLDSKGDRLNPPME